MEVRAGTKSERALGEVSPPAPLRLLVFARRSTSGAKPIEVCRGGGAEAVCLFDIVEDEDVGTLEAVRRGETRGWRMVCIEDRKGGEMEREEETSRKRRSCLERKKEPVEVLKDLKYKGK